MLISTGTFTTDELREASSTFANYISGTIYLTFLIFLSFMLLSIMTLILMGYSRYALKLLKQSIPYLFSILFLKMGLTRPLFAYFSPFHMTNTALILQMKKSVDGVLGTRTRSGRMVGADESTELWWHPLAFFLSFSVTGMC